VTIIKVMTNLMVARITMFMITMVTAIPQALRKPLNVRGGGSGGRPGQGNQRFIIRNTSRECYGY
jgi:hypothetical protein